jgi:hypothetical protein
MPPQSGRFWLSVKAEVFQSAICFVHRRAPWRGCLACAISSEQTHSLHGHDLQRQATNNEARAVPTIARIVLVRRDDDDRHRLVDQRDRPMLEFARRIAFGMDVRNLFEFEGALKTSPRIGATNLANVGLNPSPA